MGDHSHRISPHRDTYKGHRVPPSEWYKSKDSYLVSLLHLLHPTSSRSYIHENLPTELGDRSLIRSNLPVACTPGQSTDDIECRPLTDPHAPDLAEEDTTSRVFRNPLDPSDLPQRSLRETTRTIPIQIPRTGSSESLANW